MPNLTDIPGIPQFWQQTQGNPNITIVMPISLEECAPSLIAFGLKKTQHWAQIEDNDP